MLEPLVCRWGRGSRVECAWADCVLVLLMMFVRALFLTVFDWLYAQALSRMR